MLGMIVTPLASITGLKLTTALHLQSDQRFHYYYYLLLSSHPQRRMCQQSMCSKQAPVLCLPHSSLYCSLQRLSLHNGQLVLLYGSGVCAAQTYTISTPFGEKKPTYQNSSQRLDSKVITVRVAYDLNKSPHYDFPCYQSASDLILGLLVAGIVIFV